MRQHPVRRLGRGEDAIDDLVGGGQAAAFQPEDHVRPSRHRPDLDLLLPPDQARRHGSVDRVHQRPIAHPKRLHDRRGVDPRRRAERIGAQHRVVRGNPHVACLRHRLDVGRQAGEIVVAVPHHHEVDHQQIDRRVAAALADAERRAVQPRRAGLERGDARGDAEPAIAVPVPVDADVGAQFGDQRLHERDEGPRAARGRVAHRIGHAQPLGARPNRGGKEAAQRLGVRARGVLGDVHHLDAFLDREGERILGAFLEEVERPPFGVLADRTRSDERAALDRDAGPLLDLRDRPDVGHHRARGAIGADPQPSVRDRARQPLDVLRDLGAGARQADVGRVDPQPVHVVQDVDLLLDRRRANRGRLQPVAQRLVVEHRDRLVGALRRRVVVPVVDQRMRR